MGYVSGYSPSLNNFSLLPVQGDSNVMIVWKIPFCWAFCKTWLNLRGKIQVLVVSMKIPLDCEKSLC